MALKRMILSLGVAVTVSMGLGAPAMAQLEGEVTQASAREFRVALPDFNANTPEAQALADQITAIMRNDLRSTGLFDLLTPDSFIQQDLSVLVQPRFADWRIIDTESLGIGEVEIMDDGRMRVAFRLWDTAQEQEHLLSGRRGRQYVTTSENLRRVAHVLADDIYTSLTGDEGYFDSRIVFIAESGPRTARVKRLAIMDQDGANAEFLTNGQHTVLTPRFSPSDQTITYMTYERGRPQVYLFDIETGRSEALGQFQGMTYAPRFSPDGNSVIMAQADNGNSDIYIMDLNSRRRTRLTDHPAIDTSPSMSPDGDEIVFTSDRGGTPQLYVMNRDGSMRTCPSGGRDVACRITFGSGRYSTPVWSPRGDLIAFTRQANGRFYIGVIEPDGEGERLLTEAYLDEGPAWSPNGRVIIFFREDRPGASPALYTVDLTGRNLRRLNTPGDASDPAWSPTLR
ncbi:Tol-Pal system beta propeller repeat protein TolB [Ponticaulis koreensis]|uniref:Tol-Pal system beta propeller repeat protein TolB n=1 Tax=Ponticaulis koreensis TaxID=1123045 RepID=UPI000524EC57|nr:Tol-Pal system beta propeller repeat protein TolB [Ponticaulis koreensis]